jgi:hypothetical protein
MFRLASWFDKNPRPNGICTFSHILDRDPVSPGVFLWDCLPESACHDSTGQWRRPSAILDARSGSSPLGRSAGARGDDAHFPFQPAFQATMMALVRNLAGLCSPPTFWGGCARYLIGIDSGEYMTLGEDPQIPSPALLLRGIPFLGFSVLVLPIGITPQRLSRLYKEFSGLRWVSTSFKDIHLSIQIILLNFIQILTKINLLFRRGCQVHDAHKPKKLQINLLIFAARRGKARLNFNAVR